MKRLRTLIADDERNARDFLKALLAEFRSVELVGEAANGLEALQMIRSESPDLVLLDLEMPELTGFQVVRSLSAEETPLIAFVTAFDDHAIKAFEVNAVDYLLKPVETVRLAQTINRAELRLSESRARNDAVGAIRKSAGAPPGAEFFPVKEGEEISLVRVDDIASVIAEGELLHLTTKDNSKYLVNYRLKDLESRFGEERFIRLSRGALANISMLQSVSALPGGSYLVQLSNGQRIQASRSQSKVLRNRILKL